jgi:hypothetical protein
MLTHYSQAELLQLSRDASVLAFKYTIPELEALIAEYQVIYQNLLSKNLHNNS